MLNICIYMSTFPYPTLFLYYYIGCDIDCLECMNLETCIICKTDYKYLYEGKCYATCPIGTYTSNTGTCEKCDFSCKACSGPSKY